MLRFVLHKLVSKKWLALCLLIGNILLTAVASSNPLYTDAILQRALTKHLSATLQEENVHPAELRFSRNDSYANGTRENYAKVISDMDALIQEQELSKVLTLEEHTLKIGTAKLLGIRGDDRATTVTMACLSDFSSHINIVSGSLYSDTIQDGVIEAVVSQVLQREKNYLVGDEYELASILQADGTPFRVKIVGVYAAAESTDVYWNGRSVNLNPNMVISEAVFLSNFADKDTSCRTSYFLDYTQIKPADINDILDKLAGLKAEVDAGEYGYFTENLSEQLTEFLPEATQFRATLLVLYAPVFALLAAFIFMVSRQLMDLEENEIAVIVSRGSKKSQIILIYFLQAAILAVLGSIAGYPLGFLLCQLLGSSNAFLEFVNRQALPMRISLNSAGYAVGAAVAACLFMTLPVFRYANRSIVQYKVQKQDQNAVPFWQKIFLDVILLAVSLYALYSFNNQKAHLAEQVLLQGSLDPLLYISSSVFIVGAGLLGIRLVPYIIRLVFSLGKRLWSPAVYTAGLRVLRTKNQQSFIMLFMVFTIALGIFNAVSARTINSNAEDRILYMGGADVVLQEVWSGDSAEPNFEKYFQIEGVESLTKVFYTQQGVVRQKTEEMENVTVMGIQTKEFGETAEFDTSLLPVHWYHYLNTMAQDPNGVLVSSNFRDKGYKLGDTITFRADGSTFSGNVMNGHGVTYQIQSDSSKIMTGTIYGFVDYWPAYAPTRTEVAGSGEVVHTENYLIVANLAQMQLVNGVKPYQVWIKMDGSTQPVYDFVEARRLTLNTFSDTAAELIEIKNAPLFQGTNGILTANFIVVLMLCMVGFLIYWILSIRSRELQFGIFRAMGLSMGEVITMLTVEQVLISGSAIVIGVAVGALVTYLYLPLIQIAYSAADQVLPLELVTNTGDFVRLFAVIGLMVICCMVILAWLISKIRIAQALKLGED